MFKAVESKSFLPFYESANNIFEFLAFHLHHEGAVFRLPLLAIPPDPFLSLKYARTIVIEPWGVLVYKRNERLVLRAHAGKFMAEISEGCNVIFWTELMPKDADILTGLLPVKENIYWLYRYHCCVSWVPEVNLPKKKGTSGKRGHSRIKTENFAQNAKENNVRLTKNLLLAGCRPQ